MIEGEDRAADKFGFPLRGKEFLPQRHASKTSSFATRVFSGEISPRTALARSTFTFMPHETKHHGYLLSDNPERLNVDAVHAYLAQSYWCEGIPREVVARSLQNSLCLGIYHAAGGQVGLVRVISDYATFAYLCDVYVLETHRKLGLAKAALQLLQTHPKLQGLRRFQLITQDAHRLYAQFGFSVVNHAERHMEKCDRDVYRRPNSPSSRSG